MLAGIVVLFHTGDAEGIAAWQRFLGVVSSVLGFFVISGYSIAHSIDAHPAGFFRRRFRRLYPMCFAAILLGLSVLLVTGAPYVDAAGFAITGPSPLSLAMLFLLLNGVIAATPNFLHPLWSLNCEALYYLAAPWLRTLGNPAIWTVLIASMASYSLYAIYITRGGHTVGILGIDAARLVWVWLIGFLAYRQPGSLVLAVFATTLCADVIGSLRPPSEGPGAPYVFIAVVGIVVFLPRLAVPKAFIRPASYLGELSFPLYLVHFPVILLCGAVLHDEPASIISGSCWVASLAVAALFYHGIDVPVRKRRHRSGPL